MNKTANPKLTLGPREKYTENLAKMTAKLLKNEGVVKDLGGKYRFSIVAVVANNTKKAQFELWDALEQQNRVRMHVMANRKKHANTGKDPVGAVSIVNPETEHDLKAINADVAAKREVYIQQIVALRKVVDEVEKRTAELEKQYDVPIGEISKAITSWLEHAEKDIISKVIDLQPDKTILRVDMLINGLRCETVLDPTVDEIQMSAASASQLGIPLNARVSALTRHLQ